MSDARGRRGQADGIGVVLLTALVILGVGTFGGFYLQSVDDQTSAAGVSADLQVVATNESGADKTTIVVTHRGGDTIDDGVVYLRDQDVSYELEPNPFEAGHDNSTRLTGVPAQSQLRVLIVENVTDAVVFQSPVTVRGSGADPGPVAPSDSTPPSVTLDQPTGGETLTAGNAYTINWTATDGETSVTGIDIAYSNDGGSSWSTVVSDTADDGSYDWTVPNDDTSEARIRVTATDEGGNTATDQSGDFTVEPAADDVGNDGASGENESVTIPPAPASEQVQKGTVSQGASKSEVRFTIENTGSRDVTVVGISVDSTTNSQADKVERSGAEVTAGGSAVLNSVLTVGGSRTDFDTEQTIARDDSVEFDIGAFRKDGGQTRNMGNDDVTLTLYFDDGTQEQYTFSVPNK